MKSACLVGAGLGGLACALRLAQEGVSVDVFETHDRPGGRAAAFITEGGFRFDTGPTLIVMTDVIERALGKAAFANIGLRRLDPGYRVLWPNGDSFDLSCDVATLLREIEGFEPGRSAAALSYLATVHEQFRESRAKILEVDHSLKSTLQLIMRPGKLRPWVFRKLRAFTERWFRSPRIIQALTFQSLYLGTSPLRAPAMYALLPVQEIVGGVWFAPGGTGAIVDALTGACENAGVRFHFGAPVDAVLSQGERATGVRTGGAIRGFDAVAINADREPAMQRFFGVPSSRLAYGHSAMVWYLGINRTVHLSHHSVLLPDDPWQAYAQLDAGVIPQEPMIYVCNPAASDSSFAPSGMSSLMLLCPVPNRKRLRDFDEEALFRRVLQRVESYAGDLQPHLVYRNARGPREFEKDFNVMYGAAFGPDHTLDQMGFLRPPIAHPRLRNVVFAGSGTRPGSGVPMVMISGRLAAERLLSA
ncbi:MAG: phytoene desaturase family protein [Candidatus Eremiobacteraeota bacterium]|nr:phytoene desaturase family protein [Candidatus Eremiobacteraeota bacterium]